MAALSKTVIVIISLTCCGVALVAAALIACLIGRYIRQRNKPKLRLDHSFRSRSRKAKFLDYERAAFKPLEPSTRSSIYWTGNTGRKDIHVLPYSYIDLKPKEPPKDYDFANPIYRPFVDLNREWDQSVIPVNENTFYIPYKLKNRYDAKHSSVTSNSDTDTESELDDGWPIRSVTNFKPGLPRYITE